MPIGVGCTIRYPAGSDHGVYYNVTKQNGDLLICESTDSPTECRGDPHSTPNAHTLICMKATTRTPTDLAGRSVSCGPGAARWVSIHMEHPTEGRATGSGKVRPHRS